MPELDFSKLPNRGWVLDEVVDLDDLAGERQQCGTDPITSNCKPVTVLSHRRLP